MEKKNIGTFFANAGSATKDAISKAKEKAIQAVDQNDDGVFDMADMSAVSDAVGGAVKKGVSVIKESAEETRKRIDLKALQPVFPDTLDEAEFYMPKLIRVADRDKKHTESDVCQGSIGFLSDKGGLRLLTLFKDSLDTFGLSFYPDADCEFYYVNPTDRDNYIALDDYFSYLKTVRINELQRVAQNLGAKYFKVTYKEERTSFSETKGSTRVKVSGAGSSESDHAAAEKKYSMIDVAVEMHMDGHAPQKPELVYLLKDDNVQNLIHLRMIGGEGFRNHRISIKLSNSSGIKESDAVRIDAVLKGMKVSGNSTVASEARHESRRYLEYEIEF